MKPYAIALACAALLFSGCVSSPEKSVARIEELQARIDAIGLEEIDAAANFGSVNYKVTREDGERVAEFEQKSTFLPRFYFRTRKPLAD